MGIKRKPTTDYNRQGNSINERIHQVLGNQLWSCELEEQNLIRVEKTLSHLSRFVLM